MRYKEPYCLFPKKLPSGKTVFYYSTYDDLGRRRQFSTGLIKKTDAKRYCQKLFQSGSMIIEKEKKFDEYTENWFIYDKCSYIQSKLLRGFSYSRSNAKRNRGFLTQRILPYFGKYYLKDIKAAHCEDWLKGIKKSGVSNLTANHYLSILRIIFNEAYRKDDIPFNTIKAVQPLSVDSKAKDVLTSKEVEELFNRTDREKIWPQQLYYLINLVASQTGMRLGEIQALRTENLHEDHIIVKHSWDREYGLKSTKTGVERIVPITKDLYTELTSFYQINKYTGPYFFSAFNREQPVDHKAIYKWTYRALEKIKINKKIRTERKLTFHCWRSFYNSQLLSKGVPISIVQAIIGHSGDGKMTRHYSRFSLEDLKNTIIDA